MATAAELTGEEIAAVAESLSDPANLNVDTMTAIMHRIGPGLMALGQKVLVALIIFLIGRKIISMIEKMLSRSMEHAGHGRWRLAGVLIDPIINLVKFELIILQRSPFFCGICKLRASCQYLDRRTCRQEYSQ